MLITDEPAKLGGQDLDPDLYTLVLSAPVYCKSATFRIYIDHKGLDIRQISVYANMLLMLEIRGPSCFIKRRIGHCESCICETAAATNPLRSKLSGIQDPERNYRNYLGLRDGGNRDCRNGNVPNENGSGDQSINARLMKLKIVIVVSLLILAKFSQAQNFRLMRYDEDYSALRDSTPTFYNRLKYQPLSKSGHFYLSFGGQARIEGDRAQNEDWGGRKVGTQVFLLQRYQLHADLHLGDRVRIFGQLRSGLEHGRKTGPRPIDEDQLNVQNLFVDLIPYLGQAQKITVRLGRQELQYGSGRLVDVQEGPNIRLYFDGAKVAYSSAKLTVDGFVMANGGIKTGVFDNPSSRKASLWGVYSTWFAAKKINFDLSYLGISRNGAKFDEGIADELRHTLAARFWNWGSGFLYNLETSYQFGSFGQGKIRAWGVSADVGYKFVNLKGSPTLNLRSDLVSGDTHKGDGRLGTMNGLYPNGGYFGVYPQAGPANIMSLHPSVAWNPVTGVRFTLEMIYNWRHSLQDGIYRPSGAFSLSSSGSLKRYIGTSCMAMIIWNINPYLNCILGAQYFDTGAYIDNIIPDNKNGFFTASQWAFKF